MAASESNDNHGNVDKTLSLFSFKQNDFALIIRGGWEYILLVPLIAS